MNKKNQKIFEVESEILFIELRSRHAQDCCDNQAIFH